MMRPIVRPMLSLISVAVIALGLEQHSGAEDAKPLPDTVTMMQKVIANERAAEATQRDYLVTEWLSFTDGKGTVWSHGSGWTFVKGDGRESEVFWLRGVRVSRLVRISGSKDRKHTYDHVLTTEELRQQNASIDAELSDIAKAREAGNMESKRNEADGLDEIRMSRFLELGTFSNPRRGKDNPDGRDTVDIDYKGTQCTQDCSFLDSAASKIAGVLTIDEEDMTVYKFEGVFTDTWTESGRGWKVSSGAELQYWGRHQDEGIRFPGMMEVRTTVRHGSSFTTHTVALFYRDYKKFRVTSTILPDVTFLPDSSLHEAPPGTP